MSAGRLAARLGKCVSSHVGLKYSMPVLLGGESAKKGSLTRDASQFSSTVPLDAHSPPWSKAASEWWRRYHSSSRQFAGPVSKPTVAVSGARTVRLAMPPRLTTMRVLAGSLNKCSCRSGASGAPSPPAARSARSEEHTSELQSRGHLVDRLL